jgi:hypothetical protein
MSRARGRRTARPRAATACRRPDSGDAKIEQRRRSFSAAGDRGRFENAPACGQGWLSHETYLAWAGGDSYITCGLLVVRAGGAQSDSQSVSQPPPDGFTEPIESVPRSHRSAERATQERRGERDAYSGGWPLSSSPSSDHHRFERSDHLGSTRASLRRAEPTTRSTSDPACCWRPSVRKPMLHARRRCQRLLRRMHPPRSASRDRFCRRQLPRNESSPAGTEPRSLLDMNAH